MFGKGGKQQGVAAEHAALCCILFALCLAVHECKKVSLHAHADVQLLVRLDGDESTLPCWVM